MIILRIVMDDREPEIIEQLLRKQGALVDRKRIEIADYLIGENVCVERKSLNDFIRSIYDGRLFDQIDQMENSCNIIVVLVEEPHFYIRANSKPHYLGALSSLVLRGVSVIHVASSDDTAKFLFYLVRKVEGERPSIIPVRKRRKPKSWEEAFAVLTSFPGIGPKSAEKLLKEFGTLKEVFNADFVRLKKVIGEAKAEKLREVINAPFKRVKETKLED